ncbi:MAG: hypothetical protein UW35_C0029G0008 [Candidatus Collierbacteria bacterium GW2011_GWF2_44_15]|uniref:Uncharacterized protein n=4 Tax=Candidatus Collieribacteriota TaxID=1752725 RepID=A0A0G1HH37_9BACT|nr:MAG: hypothetical protein UW23_C0001G0048 [Candidatus Collierbacteria bacterium GW2011_GWA1_44_12]KKT45853.1 MAG: hypothetical protein UW35_C0029G0008 [Candidatus Collierbacteria bacterium GW2011_GWF2_44_15]KKT98283.1 MAG: hypothetical protein UW99_C0024G0008 [Candidatus Collierbacteria bacterium GW2011_GWC2_45_15]KKU28154.1 MAG: hypothetical protein UX41_C0039G0002 [Candidatus Collierbacteria bacterium GW2011_GWE1_46_18]
MNDNPLIVIAFFALMIALLFGILFPVSLLDAPTNIEPGDGIVVLSGQTILADGQPCQENRAGFVSLTSPEGKQSWYKLPTWFFPTHRMISVIYTDGTIEWVRDSLVVIPSAEYQLCPSR